MKKLVLGFIVALAVSANAQTNRIYIPVSSCSVVPSSDFVGAAAQRIDNAGANHTYVSYRFGSILSSVVGCHFYMPSNNPTYTFQPQFIFKGSIPPTAGPIYFGATAVANVRDDSYNDDGPQIARNNIVSVTTAPALAGTTKVATQTQMIVADPGGQPCGALGTTCRDMLVTMWVVRLVENNSCFDILSPWTCCTGLQLGTCVPGATYTGDVDLLGIELVY